MRTSPKSGNCCSAKFALAVLSAAMLPLYTLAEEVVRTERPSHEYEKCALVIQMQLDQAATSCLARAESSSDEETGACLQKAKQAYESELKSCPADTGPPDRR